MPRNFESLNKTSDKSQVHPKSSEDSNAKLARLRAEHGFKMPKTAEQWGNDDDQAEAKWEANSLATKQEIAQETAQSCEMPRGYIPKKPGLLGGVITDILKPRTMYLRDYEKEPFESGRTLRKKGTKQVDLSPQQRETAKLYDTIMNLRKSGRVYSNEEVYNKLDGKRCTSDYQAAFPPELYGQPSRAISLQEQNSALEQHSEDNDSNERQREHQSIEEMQRTQLDNLRSDPTRLAVIQPQFNRMVETIRQRRDNQLAE